MGSLEGIARQNIQLHLFQMPVRDYTLPDYSITNRPVAPIGFSATMQHVL
jgi:hypothetical protein